MSSSNRQFVVVAGFTWAVLMTGVMTSPVVRQRRSDDGGPLETVVEQLSAQVNHLNAQLNSVNTELTALKTKTATMDKMVAFHAWNDQNPVHAAPQSPVILNHAATNIGNAYDTLTGIFTAPTSGLYDFQASFMDYERSSSSTIRGAIYVDNSRETVTISDSRQGSYDHATMRAIVHVNAGQEVYLKNIDDTNQEYYSSGSLPYTTFSGFLIKAD